MIERLLEDFSLSTSSSSSSRLVLTTTTPSSYTYTLTLVNPTTLRQTLHGADRPLPPQDNVLPGVSAQELPLAGLKVDEARKEATFQLHGGGSARAKRVVLRWSTSLSLSVFETLPLGGEQEEEEERLVFGTLNNRGFVLGEHGVTRYDWCVADAIRCGMGEKGAPLGESRASESEQRCRDSREGK